MALPDAWLETTRPAPLPEWVIVSGRTFQRRFQVQAGTPLQAVSLAGCSVECEINDRRGGKIIILDADVTDAPNGWIRVRLTPAQTAGIPFQGDRPPETATQVIGRGDVVITDGNGDRVSVGIADVRLQRGESA